jgi:hypothetical protein
VDQLDVDVRTAGGGDTRQDWNQWTGVLRLLSARSPSGWWAGPVLVETREAAA